MSRMPRTHWLPPAALRREPGSLTFLLPFVHRTDYERAVRRGFALGAGLVMLLWILWACAVHAHGDAAWIRAGAYVDRNEVHCCGEHDCAVAQPGELKAIPGGWLHVPTGTSIPDHLPGIYPSIDLQLWRCVRGGELKCVFPAGGV